MFLEELEGEPNARYRSRSKDAIAASANEQRYEQPEKISPKYLIVGVEPE
jgi:hypothetical protein